MREISVDDLNKTLNNNTPGKSLVKRLIDVIPFIDPDSTRFVEWIWTIRQDAGLSTYSQDYRLPSNSIYSLEQCIAKLKEELPVGFESPYYYRALTVAKVNTRESAATDAVFKAQFAMKDLLERCTAMPPSYIDRLVAKFKSLFNGTKNTKVDQFTPVHQETIEVPSLYIVVAKNGSGITFTAVGDQTIVQTWMKYFETTFTEPETITLNNLTGFDATGNPVVKVRQMTEDHQPLANNEFYPWLEGGIDAFVKAYRESKASVLLLVGDPGTGKSTFLRTLLFRMQYSSIGLANNENCLHHPGLVPWMEALGECSLIAVEDADSLVEARSEGNKQMSAVLNFADGVYSNRDKLVISTNLSNTKKIDEALIRPGRAFQILTFRLLTAEEGNAARASIGLPAAELPSKVTLSEALNFINLRDVAERSRVKAGFVQ